MSFFLHCHIAHVDEAVVDLWTGVFVRVYHEVGDSVQSNRCAARGVKVNVWERRSWQTIPGLGTLAMVCFASLDYLLLVRAGEWCFRILKGFLSWALITGVAYLYMSGVVGPK